MEILNSAIATLFVLGVTIFVHEFGHFITAKAFGIRVFVFSFGFGQRLLGFKWGDTDCRLSLIPLGGYVKLEGEADDKISEDTSHLGDSRDFTARPRWQRIVVYLAGPFMNVVLTVAVLSGIYIHGADMPDLSDAPIIGLVAAGSPAQAAGLERGDEILAIDGERVTTWEQVLMTIALRPDREVRIRYRRGGDEREVSVKTRAAERNIGDIGAHPFVIISQLTAGAPAQKAGLQVGDVILRMNGKTIHAFEEIPPIVLASPDRPVRMEISRQGQLKAFDVVPQGGKIGIWGGRMAYKKFGVFRSIAEATRHTARLAVETVRMLRQLITGLISPRVALSGPLEIFRASGEAAREGWLKTLLLTAMISLSVGILNLLPLPPLDGGHLAILYVESAIRRDLGMRAKTWIINVGAAMVLLLILTVIYFDLLKQAWFKRLVE